MTDMTGAEDVTAATDDDPPNPHRARIARIAAALDLYRARAEPDGGIGALSDALTIVWYGANVDAGMSAALAQMAKISRSEEARQLVLDLLDYPGICVTVNGHAVGGVAADGGSDISAGQENC